MKIQNLNFSPNFCAKHKDVRKADDIVRKSNQEFTMFHPSYALQFYNTLNKKTPQAKENEKKILNNFAYKFYNKVRVPSENAEEKNANTTPYIDTLKILKREKMGNCRECAIATLATLYANGYHNSIPASLNFDYKFTDKQTGEVKLEGSKEIDHVVVLSDMNNKERKGDVNKCVVLDSWLNYADDAKSAAVKYGALFGKQIDEKLISLIEENNIDPKNTQVRFYPYYTVAEFENKKSAQKIGDLAKEHYPSILMNNL